MNFVRILCFGDSNTWGYVPSRSHQDQRYSADVRWTGLLQKNLGPSFIVIEEGLNSRTTSLDYHDLLGKNGLKSLPEILKKHFPIHLVILFLGTNDLKKIFDRTPEQIAEGMEKLIQCVESWSVQSHSSPKILVLAPPLPKLNVIYDAYRYPELEMKAKKLASVYQEVSERKKTEFMDLSQIVESSDIDGAHLDADQHAKLATSLTEIIENWALPIGRETLRIRRATDDDLDQLIHLGRKTFLETYKGMGSGRPEGLEELYGLETFNVQSLMPILNLYSLVEVEEIPIGFFKLEFGEPPSCVPDRKAAQLSQAYLLKPFQGCGIGKKMIEEAKKVAVKNGFKSLWTGVYDQNKRAIEFYLKQGFQQVGNAEWKFQHGSIDYVDIDLILYLA